MTDARTTTEIDRVSEMEWNELCLQFRDATINQTWGFGAVLTGDRNISHIVLKRDGLVLSAAQVRIVTVPILRAGIAYVAWGPMWRRVGLDDNIRCFRDMLKALRAEYVSRRGLLLRVLPNVFDDYPNVKELCCVATNLGFRRRDSSHHTLFLRLESPLDELRRGLHQKWRNCLNQAERNDLQVRAGTGDGLFSRFRSIYREMMARKRYATDVDIDKYAAIQRRLSDALKPRIVLCEQAGKPMAGGVFSTTGDTGIWLLGATSDEALQNKAAYLVHWHIIGWLKENGFCSYDLGGVDATKTPGTYQFKARICGKNPIVRTRIAEFVACDSLLSNWVVKSGDRMRAYRRKIRGAIAS